MAQLFISYSQSDREKAGQLANALRTLGWHVWWDPEVRSGQQFDRVIEKALRESDCIVVLRSRRWRSALTRQAGLRTSLESFDGCSCLPPVAVSTSMWRERISRAVPTSMHVPGSTVSRSVGGVGALGSIAVNIHALESLGRSIPAAIAE